MVIYQSPCITVRNHTPASTLVENRIVVFSNPSKNTQNNTCDSLLALPSDTTYQLALLPKIESSSFQIQVKHTKNNTCDKPIAQTDVIQAKHIINTLTCVSYMFHFSNTIQPVVKKQKQTMCLFVLLIKKKKYLNLVSQDTIFR